jgi:hypothetical protein
MIQLSWKGQSLMRSGLVCGGTWFIRSSTFVPEVQNMAKSSIHLSSVAWSEDVVVCLDLGC